MSDYETRTIFVLNETEVLQEDIYDGVWRGTLELRSLLPRRKWPSAIYRAISTYQGKILTLEGETYQVPEDKVLFADADFRWLDNCYLSTRASGERTYHRCREIERVIVLDLFFQITFPMTIARSYR